MKKLMGAAVAASLVFTPATVAPQAQAKVFTPPVLTTKKCYPNCENEKGKNNTGGTQNNTQDNKSSSDIGAAIGVIVLLALFLPIMAWFNPYNPNGSFANA
ncbi:hypothetical protein [Corynebacterium riegelii]|uniref:hypothetical protein n=1 Tax=Corynebacterium riegelii TaxID=156976 RepID=UPI00191E00EE|nr:hypothetical protein [Corynebacterium riegelii]QQU84511.1 hypothetical protein I6I71_02795 [Corynebacterium riegelii]